MKLSLVKGTTSKIVHLFIKDSSSTAGDGGLTGLAFNTASLVAYYVRPGDTGPTAITLATCTLGTYTSGGFREVSSSNMPGVYEFHIPNACLASGANQVFIMLKGAANMSPCVLEIELTAVNNQDATAFGLSLVPSDMLRISGDSGAADALETMLDGTGGQTLSLGKLNITASSGDAVTITANTSTANAIVVSGGGISGYALMIQAAYGVGIQGSVGQAVQILSTGGDYPALSIISGSGKGLYVEGGSGKAAIYAAGAVTFTGTTSLAALTTSGTVTLNALTVSNATTLSGAVTASNASNNIVGIDVKKISGDGTAADNLETMLDGTGGQTLSLGKLAINSASGSAFTITSASGDVVRITTTADDAAGILIDSGGLNAFGIKIYADSTGARAIDATTGNIHGNFAGDITGDLTGDLIVGTITTSGAVTFNGLTTLNAGLSVGGTTTVSLANETITADTIQSNAITAAKIATGAITNSKFAAGAIDATAIAADAIGSTKIADNAITAAKIADGAIDAGAFAADAITASAIAADAIGSSELAASAVNEIAAAVTAGNLGPGAFPITVTVNDGATALQNAYVRITAAGITQAFGYTNGSGQLTFSLDAGTYTVTITKSGYTFTATTRTVTGSEAGTLTTALSMTATVLPSVPADPTKGTVYLDIIDQSDLSAPDNVPMTATRVPNVIAKAGSVLVPTTVSGVSVDGRVTLELIGNSQITPSGSKWRIQCPAVGFDQTLTITAATVTNLGSYVT